MRWSKTYIPTLKETPAEAEVASHRLLLRAGYIRQLTSGIYNYLPLGVRSLAKVSAIVRREMEAAGAREVLLPMVQPAGLWKETGRWDFYGDELLRVKDRKQSDHCLGPTHEEVITDLVRGEVGSYKQLPLNLYQIQTKFRDERRPRFGLMRGREFVMKDAYSFDADDAGAEASYKLMFDAYTRIFRALGLDFKAVEADSGQIGGAFSHEFMVLAETGEDVIADCAACDYAANLEKAQFKTECLSSSSVPDCPPVEEADTPNAHTVGQVAAFFGTEESRVIKSLVYVAEGGEYDGQAVMALVRGDRELNEVKLKNVLGAVEVHLADDETVKRVTRAPVGFAGPVGVGDDVARVLADHELCGKSGYVAGANKANSHCIHVHLQRDARVDAYADLRVAAAGDACPKCATAMTLKRGIEVGHVFKLGTKYSAAMGAKFLDQNGKEQSMIMGCYGIGVSRVIAAAIEQNHDEGGLIMPPPIAPYEVCMVVMANKKDPSVMERAEELYEMLGTLGVDVIMDDRDERPGVKFNEGDLVGFPIQLVVGGKGLGRGIVEAKDRRSGEKTELSLEGFAEAFATWRASVWQGWGL